MTAPGSSSSSSSLVPPPQSSSNEDTNNAPPHQQQQQPPISATSFTSHTLSHFKSLQEEMNTLLHNQDILMELMQREYGDVDLMLRGRDSSAAVVEEELNGDPASEESAQNAAADNAKDPNTNDIANQDLITLKSLKTTYDKLPAYSQKLASMMRDMKQIPMEMAQLEQKVQKLRMRK